MRVLILGASGILGQHMRSQWEKIKGHPIFSETVECVYHKKTPAPSYIDADLSDPERILSLLTTISPDVVVNLAGDSDVDAVEQFPQGTSGSPAYFTNVALPSIVVQWCKQNGRFLIHVSSQAVYDGESGPYGPDSERRPINEYGRQKLRAESLIEGPHCTVVRLTFVLGIRPNPALGRTNPLEHMLSGKQSKQVYDRWFSPIFADDAADRLWVAVFRRQPGTIQVGIPQAVSRFDIASMVASICYERGLDLKFEPVRHEDFPGIAARPKNTVYCNSEFNSPLVRGLRRLLLPE